ncbi:hypothetical protein UR07_01920 [Pasteurella multocida subsp. multocida]|nr:hypothetical protein UR07_01920 [Pasteurella multocida subsp. multocida]
MTKGFEFTLATNLSQLTLFRETKMRLFRRLNKFCKGGVIKVTYFIFGINKMITRIHIAIRFYNQRFTTSWLMNTTTRRRL